MEESIFDKLYGATKEVLDAAKKPFVRKKYKRLMKAYYDETASRAIDCEGRIQKQREKFDCCDMNAVVEARLQAEKAKKIMEIVKTEYNEVFGEEMKIEEE